MATQEFRIAMLNTDFPVPEVYTNRAPTYGQIFHELLSAASSRLQETSSYLVPRVVSTEFDVTKLEYPPDIALFDAILITGSANAAYDDIPWIHQLDDYVLDMFTNHPRIKMFGSCFGHQLICQTLLKKYGVLAEKDPNGYEMGVQPITLSPEFRSALHNASPSRPTFPETLRLQFVHGDHVKIPSTATIPPSWINIGSTSHCQCQGIYLQGRILTYQGHFEFDKYINAETLKYFSGQGWAIGARLDEYLAAVGAEDDAEVAADIVLQFLMEGVKEGVTMGYHISGGLLTPPVHE